MSASRQWKANSNVSVAVEPLPPGSVVCSLSWKPTEDGLETLFCSGDGECMLLRNHRSVALFLKCQHSFKIQVQAVSKLPNSNNPHPVRSPIIKGGRCQLGWEFGVSC